MNVQSHGMHAPSLHQAGHTQHARRAAARRQASPHPAPRTLHLYQGACRASAQDSTSGGDPAGASSDSYFMQLALEQAKTAASLEEVPIGAVVVDADGRTVLAACHNRTHTDKDPTAHAELQAIQQAARKLGNWRLQGTTLYSTLEPCPMCESCALSSAAACRDAALEQGWAPQLADLLWPCALTCLLWVCLCRRWSYLTSTSWAACVRSSATPLGC